MAVVDAEIARRTLTGVADLRRTARARLFAFWLPMQVFGVAMLGAGLGGLAFGRSALALLQASASIVAAVIVMVLYRRRGLRTGLRRRSWPFAIVSAVGFALCFAAAVLLRVHPADAGPWLCAALVCLVFAGLTRSGVTAMWAAAMGGVAIAFSTLAPTAPAGSITSVEGGMALVAGTTLLVLRRRRPDVPHP